MIESAVALIAACLPTVYGLFGHRFVDSIVRSVHSLRSLGSRGSSARRSEHDASNHTHTRAAEVKLESRTSDTSGAPIMPSYLEPNSVETSAVKDTDGAKAAENVEHGKIVVGNSISQTENMV